MIFTRRTGSVCTRLHLEDNLLGQIREVKLLGVWISENLDWEKITDICKRAYARVSLLCKLKYVGMKKKDLLTIFISFIRSLLEYACVVWHSSLTINQTRSIERVQKVCLKVILGQDYGEYETALEACNLESLEARRVKLCLSFGRKCISHQSHRSIFPESRQDHEHNLRHQLQYHVNHARTEKYRKSSVPYIQRLMNSQTM